MKIISIIAALAVSSVALANPPAAQTNTGSAAATATAPAAGTAVAASTPLSKEEATKACAAEKTKNLAKCVSEKMKAPKVN
jgi:hypothetical protein